jgi:hypothetical protein
MTKLVIAALLVAGCASDTSDPPREVLPNLELPPAPENGLQVLTPIVRRLEQGTDNEIYTWTDQITDRAVDVRSVQGFQTRPGGHHIVVYYTTVLQPAGTQRICKDSDMASFRYVVGHAGDGSVYEPPGDLVHQIPAGAQIVLNHHYLNVYDQVLDGQTVVNLNFADPGGTYTRSSAMAIVDTSLAVPPGLQEYKVNCTVADRELKLWYLIPHMHRWGSSITVDVTRSGTKSRAILVEQWAPEFTFHPPTNYYDLTTPLVLAPGDSVEVGCRFNNDTGNMLNFGFEMCLTFGEFVDDKNIGSWACDKGHWVAM